MDESKESGSDEPGLIHGIKARIVEFCVGLGAHYLRFLALAPIFGGTVIALMLTGALTQASDYLEPIWKWVMPESRQENFSGGITEFGLPIAWEYRGIIFWIPFAIGIAEQLSGKRLRRAGVHVKFWLYILLPIFGAMTLFALLFLDINSSRLTGSFILLFMNAVLLGSAMMGIGGLMIISLVEDKLVEKWTQPNETPASS